MNIFFVHQNFPGQYKHLFAELAGQPSHRVVGIGEEQAVKSRYAQARLPERTWLVGYKKPDGGSAQTHPYLRGFEGSTRRGQQVARSAMDLRRKGLVPDVICVHPGWGESLFLRDIFPRARVIAFCEFYYRGQGADVGFDPEFTPDADDIFRLRVKNATLNQSLIDCDQGIAPTQWQKQVHPDLFHSKIEVVHDGVDTAQVRPDPAAAFTLADGRVLRAGDPVITFVNRNLEPYRGFHVFMRALPRIQARCPDAQIVIVGGDDVSYGKPSPAGSYRKQMLDEMAGQIDLSRVHFTGKIPYPDYLRLLQVSAAHVYLTYPFVLSWSMLEAMSAGCLVIGSRTAPVEEVIRHGENGLLCDFFDGEGLAQQVTEVLQQPQRFQAMRQQARATVIEQYDLRRVCLPKQLALIRG